MHVERDNTYTILEEMGCVLIETDLAESSVIINNSHYTVFHGIHANIQMTTYKVHKLHEKY